MEELWHPAELRFTKPFDMRTLNRTPSWRREIARGQQAISEAVLSARHTVERCPICGESASSCFVAVYGFHYRECGACHHLYCSNPPDAEGVKNLYTGADDQGKKTIQTWTYLDSRHYQTRVETIAAPKVAYVNGFCTKPGGRWIDVGSGAGETLVAAASTGFEAVGLECDPAECAFARERGATVVEEFLTGSNAAELLKGAAVVSLFNVLEHTEDPGGVTEAISAAVEPDCLVVIEVPRHPSLSSLSNSLFPGVSCRHIVPPDHLHVFTDASLQRLTSRNGLEPLGLWYFGQDYYDLLSSAMASADLPASSLYSQALDLNSLIQPVIDQAGLSDTMIYVGRKRSDVAG